MTATKFMAIYSSAKKMLRRKIVFQHKCYGAWFTEWWRTDDEFDGRWIEPGEDYVLVDMHYYWQGHEVCHAAIEDKLWEKHGTFGIMPGDDRGRCAVIDDVTGMVVAVIMADDELDRIQGHVLVNDATADVGDVYRQFVRRHDHDHRHIGHQPI